MSAPSAQATSALADYIELFEALGRLGVEVVVIGGCAVGAYARLLGETVLSNDLDLLLTARDRSPLEGARDQLANGDRRASSARRGSSSSMRRSCMDFCRSMSLARESAQLSAYSKCSMRKFSRRHSPVSSCL